MIERAEGNGYMECSIYVEHGACSCSTGVPGNVCPLSEPDRQWCEHDRVIGDGCIDCEDADDETVALLLRCPSGDGLHITDDPDGGSCSGCKAWAAEMRAEWEAEQLAAMRDAGFRD